MSGEQDALMAALFEIERYVSSAGWDQPARLFALVNTSELLAAEPALADQLIQTSGLSSIEQDDFSCGDELGETLALIQWPETVVGVAIAIERVVLPDTVETTDPSHHEDREDVRLVVGVTRNGNRYGLARLREHLSELVQADNLVPGLSDALAETLV